MRFSAETLDLSRLPAPQAVQPIDFEIILNERIQSLSNRFDVVGINYDVGNLQVDPLAILEQEDSYREVLDLTRVNEAVLAVMPLFAVGSDLDQIAVRYGVSRLEGENDDAFRSRILVAPEALATTGTPGGYIFHAKSTSSAVKTALAYKVAPGHVGVVVQSVDGDGTVSAALLDDVRARLMRDDIKPLTDVVSVRGVDVQSVDVAAHLFIPSGPDPLLIKSKSEQALQDYVKARHFPARILRMSGLIAAAKVAGVEDVRIDNPVGDIDPGITGTVYVNSITVSYETFNG